MARILVIDDDEGLRAVVRRILERAGHKVLEAGDGEAGIELQREQPADLVLTDIYMSGKGGLPTIQQLRQEWPMLKIIAISGGERTGPLFLDDRAVAWGADRVLGKPFELRELLDAVQSLLDKIPPAP